MAKACSKPKAESSKPKAESRAPQRFGIAAAGLGARFADWSSVKPMLRAFSGRSRFVSMHAAHVRLLKRREESRLPRAGSAWALVLAMTLGGTALCIGGASAQEDVRPCQATEIEYATVGRLQVKGTLFGAGDGVFPIGPGSVVLRFGAATNVNHRAVQLRVYTMRQRVVVKSTALFWTTTVLSDTDTNLTATADGVLTDRTLRWLGLPPSMRSDGFISCDGSLCGAFGAPPKGNSPLHMGPNPIALEPFEFSADWTTFTMKYAFVSASDSPQQRSYVSLAGRAMRRTCETSRP
jgi:hypothetical protein